MKTVLASVTDKTGLYEFIKVLETFDTVRVLATGSTAKFLQEHGLACETVDSITNFPEILEGRVKTLHPKIFGGLLAKDSVLHQSQMQAHQIPWIDYAIVNLYPFEQVAKTNASEEEVIENIDVGGVALIRAAAKNHQRVVVVPSRDFYPLIIQELHEQKGQLRGEFRRMLAQRAFEHTSYYDSLISAYFLKAQSDAMPNALTLHLQKVDTLRYGENPQQQASWYKQSQDSSEKPFEQVQGKVMSANNLVDVFSACKILREFPGDPACVIIKHNNPCGVAIGSTIQDAFEKAYQTDPISAFGGIFGFNRPIAADVAEQLVQNFIEIVVAPDFSPEALSIFAPKKNIRLLQMSSLAKPYDTRPNWVLKDLEDFGLILQEDCVSAPMPELTPVTEAPVPPSTMADVTFAWKVVKHLTSNAIVVVKEGKTLGFGIGQTSRIASMTLALKQAGDKSQGAVLASDGFFPATDNIDAAAEAGIHVIVQPGGSVKDNDVIETANQRGLAMLLTHERCFKH